MTTRNNNIGLAASSFIIGALIGASVGVLFAPYKGKKNQKINCESSERNHSKFYNKN